jgi:hypothetical protein
MNPNAHPLSVAAEVAYRRETLSGANLAAARPARGSRRSTRSLRWLGRQGHRPVRAA